MIPITLENLKAFARGLDGQTLAIRGTRSRFLFRVTSGGFEYTPESTRKPRPNKWPIVERVLERYNETGSLSPGNYLEETRNASYILSVFAAYLDGQTVDPSRGFRSPEEVPDTMFVEGAIRVIRVNAYERSHEARSLCIAAHKAVCCICNFDFGAVYGAELAGYIHVHHHRPLSEIGAEYIVDPVADLSPVCPNCHAVIHHGSRLRTIDEVRRMMRRESP